MLSAEAVAFLEQTVACFYAGSQAQIAAADQALDQYRAHPQPYALLHHLVQIQCSVPVLLWAASLVEQWFKRRWRLLQAADRQACRDVVVGLVMSSATSGNKIVAQKLQHLLAIVLKADWPSGWESFIPDLLAAKLEDSDRLRILLLLAEECFARGTASHASAVRSVLAVQGPSVIGLCAREAFAASEANQFERLRNALALLGRCAPRLSLSSCIPAELLNFLPRLLHSLPAARAIVLKVLHEIATPEIGDSALPAGSHLSAWQVLQPIMGEVLSWAEAALNPSPPATPSWALLNGRERLELLMVLRSIWVGRSAGLLRIAGGSSLLARGLRLLATMLSLTARSKTGQPDGDELVVIGIEAAGELAQQRAVEGGEADLQALEPILSQAREAALMLLCERMPKHEHALVWVEAEGGEIEIEEDEAVADDGEDTDGREVELSRRARLALCELLRLRDSAAQAAVGAYLLDMLGGGLRARNALGAASACRASWALAAALDALPVSCGVGANALAGLLAASPHSRLDETLDNVDQITVACTTLLLREHPAALLGIEAQKTMGGASSTRDISAQLDEVVRALFIWALGSRSTGLSHMAGAALRSVARSRVLGPAFMQGEPPLLLRLLQGLAQTSDTTRPLEAATLDVHAALASSIASCTKWGLLDAPNCLAATDALLVHAWRRWDVAAMQLGIQNASVSMADPAAILTAEGISAVKDLTAALRLFVRVVEQLCASCIADSPAPVQSPLRCPPTSAATQCVERLLCRIHPAVVALAKGVTAALAQLFSSASAAGYSHSLSTKEGRALRQVRTYCLELFTCCSTRCDGIAHIVVPLIQALAPSFPQEPAALRSPQLLGLFIATCSSFRSEDMPQVVHLLLAPAVQAAQELQDAAALGADSTTSTAAGAIATSACGITLACALHHGAACATNQTLQAQFAATIAWALGPAAPPSLDKAEALGAAHVLARVSTLTAAARAQLQPLMRRGLAALSDVKDVRRLCCRLGLQYQSPEGNANRATMHARILGLSDAEFARLREDGSEEAEAEADVLAD